MVPFSYFRTFSSRDELQNNKDVFSLCAGSQRRTRVALTMVMLLPLRRIWSSLVILLPSGVTSLRQKHLVSHTNVELRGPN